MEDVPPSYDNINPDVLELLPPYLTTDSLISVCLVSRAYYATFIPHLWGSPASHFVRISGESISNTRFLGSSAQTTGSHNDMVYVALTRFKRTLRKARLSTRRLCHTFHLPPALSEIYGGPNATWLRDLLDWLPALQSLSVSSLPFFDHSSLVAVGRSKPTNSVEEAEQERSRAYPVKLLLAATEPNATALGISSLLKRLPHLVYLDLSYTTPARDANVLSVLSYLTDIQVLKLRGIGLKDAEVEILANAIGLRVRLLDIAENQITDNGMRSLLEACFLLPSSQIAGTQPQRGMSSVSADQYYSRRHLESWPVGLAPPSDFMSLDTIRTVELDNALVSQLTNPLTGRLAFEDIPHGGITHLYLSNNPGITIESVRSMLDLGRIHVLDVGEICSAQQAEIRAMAMRQRANSGRSIERNKSITTNDKKNVAKMHRQRISSSGAMLPSDLSAHTDGAEYSVNDTRLPGAEKLIPVLKEKASKNLTYIRIDHAVVTSHLDLAKELKSNDKRIEKVQELPGTLPLAAEMDGTDRAIVEAAASSHFANEAPAENAIFEMDATPVNRVELPGDPIHFALSPPVGDAPWHERENGMAEVLSPRRGSGAFAPEIVPANDKELVVDGEDSPVVLNASGTGMSALESASSISATCRIDETDQVTRKADIPAPLDLRQSAIARGRGVSETMPAKLIQIEVLTAKRPKGPAVKLHPYMLSNLRTLVLTKVPSQVNKDASFVIENLKNFITACSHEARIAKLKANIDYSLPPGRARQAATQQEIRKLFALQKIVLEVVEPEVKNLRNGWKHVSTRVNPYRSSTGDMDSENLWSAAEGDFSFFGEEGEEPDECGIYDNEPEKYFPSSIPDDKMLVSVEAPGPGLGTSPSHRDSASFGLVSTVGQAYGSPIRSGFPLTPHAHSGQPRSPFLSSPRDLPLGRIRRTSNDMHQHSARPVDSRRPLTSRGTIHHEMQGAPPPSRLMPTSNAGRQAQNGRPQPTIKQTPAQAAEAPMIDVVAALAAYRRDRKNAYEQAVRSAQTTGHRHIDHNDGAELDVFVEGYWDGKVEIVKDSKLNLRNRGKDERKGEVDIYGNYFEKGYLYP